MRKSLLLSRSFQKKNYSENKWDYIRASYDDSAQWTTSTHIRKAKVRVIKPNASEDTEKMDLEYTTSHNVTWYSHTRSPLAVFFYTKHALTIWPGTFGHLFCKRKTYIHMKMCMQMLTAALFVIAKTGNNSSGTSFKGWIIKQTRVHHTTEYYLTLKGSELLTHE